MKYIKISFIAIIITLFIYYKFSKDNTILFEDKLSMFILVKAHDNIDDILFDLSSQIESFDNYVNNVYYMKSNHFLLKNKPKSQFDLDYVDYRLLLESSNIIDFNIKMSDLIEEYFLNHNSSFHLTKKYLLRDFLVRFKNYFDPQIGLFKKKTFLSYPNNHLEDFILGSKYISDYKKENYIMRVEFNDLESIDKYKSSDMDSIFHSILDYNAKVFGSDLLLYNPLKVSDPFSFQLKQYINKFESVDEAISFHKDLMLSDNIYLVESIYDYYFNDGNDIGAEAIRMHQSILDSSYQINYIDYKNSLLVLEEKLIALQLDDLTDDTIIRDILIELVGDGNQTGSYSNYINSIIPQDDYLIHNLNRLFSYELEHLFSQFDQAESKFNVFDLPLNIKKHLFLKEKYVVKYFIK